MSENTMAAIAIGLSIFSMLISGWSYLTLARLRRSRAGRRQS